MADAHANFAYSTLVSPPSGTGGTSLTVGAGQGALFPTAPFNVTVWPAGAMPLASNAEIMRVTNKSTDTFTVTRAQESTTAKTFSVGAQIAATVTAKTLTDAETAFTGSGTSTDNAVVRFDGTTGAAVQNSGVTIDDSNNMAVPGTLTVTSTSAIQQSVRYNASNRLDVAVTSGGQAQFTVVGSSADDSYFVFNDSAYFGGTRTKWFGVTCADNLTATASPNVGAMFAASGQVTAGADNAHIAMFDGYLGGFASGTLSTGGFSSVTMYGLALPPISGGATNYSIYSGGGRMYHAGEIGVGVAPSDTSVLTLKAGTTGVSSLRIPHGAAPTSPVNGDMWTTTAGLFVRINGSTIGPLS